MMHSPDPNDDDGGISLLSDGIFKPPNKTLLLCGCQLWEIVHRKDDDNGVEHLFWKTRNNNKDRKWVGPEQAGVVLHFAQPPEETFC